MPVSGPGTFRAAAFHFATRLELHELSRPEDEPKRKSRDCHFADSAHDERRISCLPSSRRLVLSPTPAKLSRNAHRERLPMAAICGLVKNTIEASSEIRRNRRTNFGNLAHRNVALLLITAA